MSGRATRILLVWGRITGVGGTERRMSEAVADMIEHGHDVVSYVATTEASRLTDLLRATESRVVTARGWTSLRRIWGEFDPDLVVAFGLRPSLATRWRRVLLPRTVVGMARNGLDHGWARWMGLIDRATQGLVDLYVVNSRSVREVLIQRGIEPRRIRHVPSALPAQWFGPQVARSGPIVIGMIGNDRPEKNQLLGVDAFLASSEVAELRVYTDDGSRVAAAIPSTARSRVEIVEGAFVDPGVYDRLDVLLHPSLSESLPRVILEARARGVLVVASATGDVGEWVEPELLVPVGDLDATVGALRRALARARTSEGRSNGPRPADTHAYAEAVVGLARRRG